MTNHELCEYIYIFLKPLIILQVIQAMFALEIKKKITYIVSGKMLGLLSNR